MKQTRAQQQQIAADNLLDRVADAELTFSDSYSKSFGVRPNIGPRGAEHSLFVTFLAKLGISEDEVVAARAQHQKRMSDTFLNSAVKAYKQRRKINKQAP